MAMATAQMSVSLDGVYSGPSHLDAGFHRVTRCVIDTPAWRERMRPASRRWGEAQPANRLSRALMLASP